MRWIYLFVWTLGACIACQRSESSAAVAVPQAKNHATLARRLTLALGDSVGVSGSATANDGTLYAVAERQRFLLALKLTDGTPGLGAQPLPIDGVPEGADTESMTWIRPGLFAFGTETQEDGRADDVVLLASVGPDRVSVTDRLVVHYADFGLTPYGNQGLEGLCSVDETLLVAAETPISTRTGRYAALFRTSLSERRWYMARLHLSTSTGKISALDCRRDGEQMQVVAIERHYGTAKLLMFRMPVLGPLTDLEPRVVADLDAIVAGVPNMEGVTFAGAGQVVVLVDNDNGGITGPNEALVINVPEL